MKIKRKKEGNILICWTSFNCLRFAECPIMCEILKRQERIENVCRICIEKWVPLNCKNIIINNLLNLYSAFLGTQSTLHSKGDISSSTTNVQHPPGWCDGSHSAPERPPHTSLLVERRQSDEANQCMGMIRRPWWSEANGQIWPGCRGNTPTLFRRTSWDF